MPTLRPLVSAFLAATAFSSIPASAQVQHAAETGVAIIAPCPSFCGGPSGRFAFDTDGGEGFSTSYSSASNGDGNGQAQADLGGPTALGVLRAEAFSTGSSQVTSVASTMQGFYVGAGGLPSYTLEVVLTGETTYSAGVTVGIFRDTDPSSEFLYTTDASTMFLEVVPLTPDLDRLETMTLSLPEDGTPQVATGSLTIMDLHAGDLFYVWATLNAVGRNGTYADAFQTVNMSFTDPTGLSQTAPIPEPGTALMTLVGLAGLGGLAARRRIAMRS